MSANESPDDVTVAGLFSYPVKSCAAVTHDRARFVTEGVLHDRSWMLVDPRASPARFLTQREHPQMATLRVKVLASGALELRSDSQSSLTVAAPSTDATPRMVRVWSSEVLAEDAGDEASRWLAEALALRPSEVRLVRFHPEAKRLCNPHYAGSSGAHTRFADGYPILVVNEASLADLNSRMGRDDARRIPINRFRPNLVVSGLAAWDEDHIDELAIGTVLLRLVKPCVRCEITTTDQITGARHSEEPLNTLSRFRNNVDLGGVTFGWNAIVLRGGDVALGDEVLPGYRF